MEEKMVYLVTTGCYSDYTVRGVYSTEDKANRAAELYDGEVEPMALDDMPDAPPGMVAWRVYMERDGSTPAGWTSPLRCDDAEPYWKEPRIMKDGKMMMEMWATDEKHAIKIANERRIIMLAENQWPPHDPAKEAREKAVSRAMQCDAWFAEHDGASVAAADQAYAALVNLFGEEVAIARVRRFQDAHGLAHGAPIRNVAEYIAFLQDNGGE